MHYKKQKNLFLRQSYLDAWADYERSLTQANFIKWDYVLLTASNENQAEVYKREIERRLEKGFLPKETHYDVLPDPEGKRVGSGGATFQVLRYIAEQETEKKKVRNTERQTEGPINRQANPFQNRRILVIHSGGDSKRIPQYSACGKLFSPVPRELPDGRGSTLFDEFIISMSAVPSRIAEGMLVLSGDVLLLFNPLQIDGQFQGAAAISIKSPVEVGKDHGVYLSSETGMVQKFLHKQSEEKLREMGAVNGEGNVDLDTGAVLLEPRLLRDLYGLISVEGKTDEERFRRFCNEEARISFYGDFLYPLACEATWEGYEAEEGEGERSEALLSCRRELWRVLKTYRMKLIRLSPAEFIHFGTTKELRKLLTEEISDYEYLDWKSQVNSAVRGEGFAARNAYVEDKARIEAGVYLESALILGGSHVETGAILSHLKIKDRWIPADTVWHGIRLANGKEILRLYAVQDNPKQCEFFLGKDMKTFLKENNIHPADLWQGPPYDLWTARLYAVGDNSEKALWWAQLLYRMSRGEATTEEIESWRQAERLSLKESYEQADMERESRWEEELKEEILAKRFRWALESGEDYHRALQILGKGGISQSLFDKLMKEWAAGGFSFRIRMDYALARYIRENPLSLQEVSAEKLENRCFATIQQAIYDSAQKRISAAEGYHIAKEQVDIHLPVRVNWGGGWTDTPPYCNEQGGVVLNAALRLRGIDPVQVQIKRLKEYVVELESADVGAHQVITDLEELQDCHNPFDPFALHKAALIACGVIPLEEEKDLRTLLKSLGGGIYLSTQVIGVPKGSGLGTSSILSGACVKGIFQFLGQERSPEAIYDVVMGMEQLMSTGGGWQDQVGGLSPGIKLTTTRPGMEQQLKVETVQMPRPAQEELKERFVLIYTGQRRLARNLLRDVIGGYIGGRRDSVEALAQMKKTAILMRFALEQGEIDEFAHLLNEHWRLSCKLDQGTTNTCIDQIRMVCEEFTEGLFIAGAGGGGFLQGILKKGVQKEDLRKALRQIFQDSGVDVWEAKLLLE